MLAKNSRAHRVLVSFFSIVLVVTLGSGCGIFSPDESSDGGGGGGGTTEFRDPTTPDILIENFEKSYEELNIIEYEKVLHPQFTFWFSPDDIDQSGSLSWDRGADIESATNMFEGAQGSRVVNGETQVVPAILSIDINLEKMEQWRSDFDEGAEFAAADFRGEYEVDMTVRYTDSALISRVQGRQRFFALNVGDETTPSYQLYAWKDLGNPNI